MMKKALASVALALALTLAGVGATTAWADPASPVAGLIPPRCC